MQDRGLWAETFSRQISKQSLLRANNCSRMEKCGGKARFPSFPVGSSDTHVLMLPYPRACSTRNLDAAPGVARASLREFLYRFFRVSRSDTIYSISEEERSPSRKHDTAKNRTQYPRASFPVPVSAAPGIEVTRCRRLPPPPARRGPRVLRACARVHLVE